MTDLATRILDCPAELRAIPQWVFWRRELNDKGKVEKPPKSPHHGGDASRNKPADWATLEAALAARERFQGDGVGFTLTPELGIVGVDLDDVRDADSGHIEPWARDIVERLDSYTEVSASGEGLHVLVRGKLPLPADKDGRKDGSLEMYHHWFFYMTGEHLEGTPLEINERQAAIDSLWAEHFGGKPKAEAGTQAEPGGEVVLRAGAQPPFDRFEALRVNNERFAASWEHTRRDLKDTSFSGYDQSLADYAVQARWTDQEVANLIIAHRRKWGDEEKALRRDYTLPTIAKAREAFRLESARQTGDRATILAEVSRKLDFTVTGLQQLLCDPPQWFLLTEEFGKVPLGEASNLRVFARFQTLMMGRCKRLIRLTAKDWSKVLDTLLAATEDIPAEEATDEGLVTDLLLDYCREKPASGEIDGTRDRPAVSLRQFQSWIENHSGRSFQLNLKWLARTLRAMGFRRETFTDEQGQLRWRAWVFPQDWNFER